jgi:hypothetical protein
VGLAEADERDAGRFRGERSTNERVVHELNVKSLNDLAGSVNPVYCLAAALENDGPNKSQ